MNGRTSLDYLFGKEDAIRDVARNQASFGTGIVLVLITAIARNYDQAFILEKPLLWLLGPLLFSLVSGTWLYLVTYQILAWCWMPRESRAGFRDRSDWWTFMGLFWMTAPVAWLYAIPVERYFDSLTATRLNLGLLAIVSIWRVLLMARVLSVLCRTPFAITLLWVLLAASIEVIAVYIFGGDFSKAIMRGMGGMRTSAEDTLLLQAHGMAVNAAFWTGIGAFIGIFIFRPKNDTAPLPQREKRPVPFPKLAAIGLAWSLVAILPQIELSRNFEVEKRINSEQWRSALDYFDGHEPGDFGPSRPLPPTAYEWKVFEQLPRLIGQITETDRIWVRVHLVQRLDQMVNHSQISWGQPNTKEERIADVDYLLGRNRRDLSGFVLMVKGLQRIPEGHAWLKANDFFVEGLQRAMEDHLRERSGQKGPPATDLRDLRLLSDSLRENIGTNASIQVPDPKSPVAKPR